MYQLRSKASIILSRYPLVVKGNNGNAAKASACEYLRGQTFIFRILLVADLPKAVLLKSGLLKQLVEALQVARLNAGEKPGIVVTSSFLELVLRHE